MVVDTADGERPHSTVRVPLGVSNTPLRALDSDDARGGPRRRGMKPHRGWELEWRGSHRETARAGIGLYGRVLSFPIGFGTGFRGRCFERASDRCASESSGLLGDIDDEVFVDEFAEGAVFGLGDQLTCRTDEETDPSSCRPGTSTVADSFSSASASAYSSRARAIADPVRTDPPA
ncbi:MAG: hypothetical protein JWR01_2952 [Subtercola sp.]|nr:hypothetical protein [Subtercola sp.]